MELKKKRQIDGGNVPVHTRARSLAGTQAPNGVLTAALFLISWSDVNVN